MQCQALSEAQVKISGNVDASDSVQYCSGLYTDQNVVNVWNARGNAWHCLGSLRATVCDHSSTILGNPASSPIIRPTLSKSIISLYAFFPVLEKIIYAHMSYDQKALIFFAVLTSPCEKKRGDVYLLKTGLPLIA